MDKIALFFGEFMTFESLLIHHCYSGIRSGVRNSLGELEYTWTYGSSQIACRAIPITASERVTLPGEFSDVRYKVGMLSGSRITTSHRIKFNDEIYQVRDSHLDSSAHHRTIMISEVP